MTQYVHVPPERVDPAVLKAMIEEFVTRDGTDYGNSERSLEEKTQQLQQRLRDGEVWLICELESEQWDWLPADEAAQLIGS
ncbi:MAG: YheU family protein [Gammaproteobacteria bacterium]|nr:YheU family protein [Gammaproteobacteria bacterium]